MRSWRAPAQHLLNVSPGYLFGVKVMLIGNCGKRIGTSTNMYTKHLFIFLVHKRTAGKLYWKEPIIYFYQVIESACKAVLGKNCLQNLRYIKEFAPLVKQILCGRLHCLALLSEQQHHFLT